MIDPSTTQPRDRQLPRADGQLGRWISVFIAALFVMVILSVCGVLWLAKRNHERAARLNGFGSSPAEGGKPASR